MRILVFAIILTTCIAALKFKVETYLNTDLVTKENPFANLEVHCLQMDRDEVPVYVRGTYGQRGYFEGHVLNGTAYVNYIEVGIDAEGLTPSAGAGVLTYNNGSSVTSGKFWNSGVQSNFQENSISDWGITEKIALEDSIGFVEDWSEIALQYCFWNITGSNGGGYTRDRIHYKPWMVLGVTNPNTWFKLDIQDSFIGQIAGAYRYTYSTEDCNELYDDCKKGRVEWGIYSQGTAVAGFNDSYVLATEWKATTGPLSGESGSALYAMVAGAGGKTKQIGFFCNSKHNVDYPTLPYKKVLTSCFFDFDNLEQPDTSATRQLSQALLRISASKEYMYWWHKFSLFINTIFGDFFSSLIKEDIKAKVVAEEVVTSQDEIASSYSVRRILKRASASWWEHIWTQW